MFNIVLASTLHDPDGALEYLIPNFAPQISHLHKQAVVTVTPQTPESTRSMIENSGIKVFASGESRRETYTQSLETALEFSSEKIFWCDFDRLLHWIKHYPLEYRQIFGDRNNYNLKKDMTTHNFAIIGRTARAFLTHPVTQVVTENATNKYCSRLAGFQNSIDFSCATFMMDKNIARIILEHSVSDYGIYAEWQMICLLNAHNFGYCQVEGLEWETPDRFVEQIKEKGFERWVREFQNPAQWALRNKLMHEGMTAAYARWEEFQKTMKA